MTDRMVAMAALIASVEAAGGTVHMGAEKRHYEAEAKSPANAYLARKKANAKAVAKANAKTRKEKRAW